MTFYGVCVNINAFADRNVMHVCVCVCVCVCGVTLTGTTHDVAFIDGRLFCVKLRKYSPKGSKF